MEEGPCITKTIAPPMCLALEVVLSDEPWTGEYSEWLYSQGGGTMIREGVRFLAWVSVAARAIMVRVLPRPMGSATMPPQNSGGSSTWWAWETLFR